MQFLLGEKLHIESAERFLSGLSAVGQVAWLDQVLCIETVLRAFDGAQMALEIGEGADLHLHIYDVVSVEACRSDVLADLIR